MSTSVTIQPETMNQHQRALTEIIEAPLIAHNIDSYAEIALSKLIVLADTCINDFLVHSQTIPDTLMDTEETAFSFFGLEGMGTILEHISSRVTEIRHLDRVIARAKVTSRVITPPDPQAPPIVKNGAEPFKPGIIRPKLKNLLFILSNEFKVDLDDTEQLIITTGVVAENMVRQTSYNLVLAPKLERSILICDESKNSTFVFDTSILNRLGITEDVLMDLTKAELKAILHNNPKAGEMVRFSNNYVSYLANALRDPLHKVNMHAPPEMLNTFLLPKAPDDYITAGRLARRLGTADSAVRKAVEDIGDTFGRIQSFRFRSTAGVGYSPEQVELIVNHLDRLGRINNGPPEGHLTLMGMSKLFGIDHAVISRAIASIEGGVGDLEIFRAKSGPTVFYTPEQQKLVRTQLDMRGLYLEEPAEEYQTVSSMAKRFNTSDNTINIVIEALGDALGETKIYKRKASISTYYSPEQQDLISNQLEARGILNETAPEGYHSMGSMPEVLGVDRDAIIRAIKELGEELGSTEIYRFGPRNVPGYSPEQQALIRCQLERNGLYRPQAPEGYLTIRKLAAQLGYSRALLNKHVEFLKDKIGETPVFRFGSKIATGYSHEQQEIIRANIEATYKPRKNIKYSS